VIAKGLKSGEMVATEGLDRLEDGTPVTLQTPGTQPATRGATSRRSPNAASAPAEDNADAAAAGAQPADARPARGGNRGGE